MVDNKLEKVYVLKLFNPIVAAVKTYNILKSVVKVGSNEECDLQIFLPSLLPVHIVVDFEEHKITAIGNDVHCDTIPIAPGSSSAFSNDSVIRIHGIFMIFLELNTIEESNSYDLKIEQAASRFKEYSPVLKISHRVDSLGNSILDDLNQTNENGTALNNMYENELGEFSKITPIEKKGMIANSAKIIEKTQEEFKDMFKTEPSPEIVEAVIHKKIENIQKEVNNVLEGDVNIPLNKVNHPDLGEMAIENDLLRQAEKEIESNSNNSIANNSSGDKIAEADINSLEILKNTITDNIKEEFREEIAQMIQEEAKDHVERAVEECLKSQKFAYVIGRSVEENKNDNKEGEIKSNEILTPENDSAGNFEVKRQKLQPKFAQTDQTGQLLEADNKKENEDDKREDMKEEADVKDAKKKDMKEETNFKDAKKDDMKEDPNIEDKKKEKVNKKDIEVDTKDEKKEKEDKKDTKASKKASNESNKEKKDKEDDVKKAKKENKETKKTSNESTEDKELDVSEQKDENKSDSKKKTRSNKKAIDEPEQKQEKKTNLKNKKTAESKVDESKKTNAKSKKKEDEGKGRPKRKASVKTKK